MKTNWTKNDFEAYILYYFMESDLEVHPAEIAFIKNKVGEEVFNQIAEEIGQDNDYVRISKIQDSFERLQYDRKGKDELLDCIQQLFKVDGEHGLLERNILQGINKLLKL